MKLYKKIVTMFLILLFMGLNSNANSIELEFNNAKSLLANKKYVDALTIYKKIERDGNYSTNLYLNMANAYMLKNEMELALKNSEIADSIIAKYNYIGAKVQALKFKYHYYEKAKNFELAFKFLKERNALQDSVDKLNSDYNLENNFVDTLIQSGVTENNLKIAGNGIYYFLGLLFFIGLG